MPCIARVPAPEEALRSGPGARCCIMLDGSSFDNPPSLRIIHEGNDVTVLNIEFAGSVASALIVLLRFGFSAYN
jgi:hypothetical protein